jgi:hypothetical protein
MAVNLTSTALTGAITGSYNEGSTVVSDGTNVSNGASGNPDYYSLAYVTFAGLVEDDIVILNSQMTAAGKWWTQGRWSPESGWAYAKDGSNTKTHIGGNVNTALAPYYYITGDVNNLSGNTMASDLSHCFIFTIPDDADYIFYKVIRSAYWQDISGAFYPYGYSNNRHRMQGWHLKGN